MRAFVRLRCSARAHLAADPKYRRRQYDGIRAAAQFVAPLLPRAGGPSPPRLEAFARGLAGAPQSPAHEGPLCHANLNAFAGIGAGGLVELIGDSALTPSPSLSLHVREMWPAALQQNYAQEIMRVRGDRRDDVVPQRFEAGLAALQLFSDSGSDLSDRWRELIDRYTLMLPDRSPHHELKNLPQEIGIGELLVSLKSEMPFETIIDVGGGNGFLATQLAAKFQCESVVVDPFTPNHAIDNAAFPHWSGLPRHRPRASHRPSLRRIPRRVEDVHWSVDTNRVNFDRCVLIAKHLCGTSVDVCFQRLAAVGRLPRLLVVVPCCFNKGSYEQYCNRDHVLCVAGVDAAATWSRWTRLTDWNRSCSQEQSCCCSRPGARRRKLYDVLPCMGDVAHMVEAIVNQGRLLWLRQMGYDAFTVTYVPRCVTPKNRAIVAVRRDVLP